MIFWPPRRMSEHIRMVRANAEPLSGRPRRATASRIVRKHASHILSPWNLKRHLMSPTGRGPLKITGNLEGRPTQGQGLGPWNYGKP